MADPASRFPENPLLRPQDVRPSREGLEVQLLLNPGAFRFAGQTWLLLRVAERPLQTEGLTRLAVSDPQAEGGIRILAFDNDDPQLGREDPRAVSYAGVNYLSSLSHLRLAASDDGVHFQPAAAPTLTGEGPLETFGIEDCRVSDIEGRFCLTYTAVSPNGVGVGLRTTEDWQHFTHHGMILPPTNKDCALFPERVGGSYLALHRPSALGIGGNDIWLGRSPDLVHWGGHQCIVRSRPGTWDSARVGAGGPPIRTREGWLAIYHGADERNRYCLGALLLDIRDPARVLARSQEPIMWPTEPYECHGFFGQVVFANGQIVEGDDITLYYGASDELICGARLSLAAVMDSLR